MIFLDSNIPMYLTGAAHPLKTESQILLERIVAAGERIVTDAEVLQEILHRYAAIDRRDAIAPALQVVLDIVDEVCPRARNAVLFARVILLHPPASSAPGAVHEAAGHGTALPARRAGRAIFLAGGGLNRLHQL